jgi:hypothetical protein
VKNKNFPGSVFITGIVFVMAFFNLKDESLFALVFVFTQLFAGLGAGLLILLRLTRLINNRNSFLYYLTGTFQLALLITDIGLLFDHSLTKRSIIIFTGLNVLLGICILTDITGRSGRRDRR